VGDFGMAELLKIRQKGKEVAGCHLAVLTARGEVAGAAEYLAPEQITGEAAVRASDVYALGALVYRMVTGQAAFPGRNPVDVLLRHLDATPRTPRELCPELPPAAEDAILKALARTPEMRFSTAGEFSQAFRAALPEGPAGDANKVKLAPARPRWR